MHGSQKWAGGACFLVAAGAAALSMSGNYFMGERQSVTEIGSMWQGAAALYIDVIVLGFAIALGAMIKMRARTGAFLCLIGLMASGAMSIYSLASFQIDEKINKIATADGNFEAEQKAVAERNTLKKNMWERDVAWRRNDMRAAITKSDRREKQRLYDEAKNNPPVMEFATRASQASLASTEMGGFMNLDARQTQVAVIIFTTLLIVAGKGAFGALGGFFWSAGGAVAHLAKDEEDVPESDVPESENITPVAVKTKAMRPVSGASATAVAEDTDKVAAKLAPQIAADLAYLKEFFSDELCPAFGARVSATDLYGRYSAWATARGLTVLKQNRFGRDCSSIIALRGIPGLYRLEATSLHEYTGWMLKSAGGERGAPLVKAA